MILVINGNSNFNLKSIYTKKITPSKLHSSIFYYYSLLVLIFIYYIFLTGRLNPQLTSKRFRFAKQFDRNTNFLVKIYFFKKKKTKFFKTIQRAPMAHRQWSQEQYEFRYYSYTIKIKQMDHPYREFLSNNVLLKNNPFSGFKHQPEFLFNTSLLNFNNLTFRRFFNYYLYN